MLTGYSIYAQNENTTWVGFDFDGTLSKWDPNKPEKLGPPVYAMINLLRLYVNNGVKVKIVTARVAHGNTQYRKALHKWLKKYVGFVPEITSEKDENMVILYDDRAIGVKMNEGVLKEK